jgi:hypothetical protein
MKIRDAKTDSEFCLFWRILFCRSQPNSVANKAAYQYPRPRRGSLQSDKLCHPNLKSSAFSTAALPAPISVAIPDQEDKEDKDIHAS